MIEHINEWPWGKTITLIYADGQATVDMSFEKNNPGVCYLSGLSVIPEARRQGMASSLMQHCINYCRANDIFRIDINSVKEPFIMDFYHKLGFIDLDENEGFMRMYRMIK